MIDKLTIASDHMDLEALKHALGPTVTAKPVFNLYDICQKVSSTHGTHLFTAYTGPRTPNMRLFRLELNPTKLSLKYTDLMTILDNVMDISEATIQRIDHASDIEMPILEAFETIRIKHKRKVRSYNDYENGELTGFYIGSKFEQALIYNKSCPPYGTKFKSSKQLANLSHLTRFEVRHHSRKVPFRKLNELPFLQTFNPYQHFEVLKLNQEDDGFAVFRRRNRNHGMQNSFMKLNKQNNFRRDSAKYFDNSDLPGQLARGYQSNLSRFFEGCHDGI
jgi:hypothetical protein